MAQSAVVLACLGLWGCSGESDNIARSSIPVASPIATSSPRLPQAEEVDGASGAAETQTQTRPNETASAINTGAALEALQDRRAEVEVVALAAIAKATNECLAPYGFTYDEGPDPGTEETLPPPHYAWFPPLPGGTDDRDAVLADEGEIVEEPLDPKYEAALVGSVIDQWTADTSDAGGPSYGGRPLAGDVYDGCLPTAQREIVGGGEARSATLLLDLEYMFDDVELQAVWRVRSDEDFQRVAGEWRRCMADNGVDVDMFDGGSDDREDYPEFDAQCLQSTGLTDLGNRLLLKYKDEVYARLVGDPTEINSELDQILARANAVLG